MGTSGGSHLLSRLEECAARTFPDERVHRWFSIPGQWKCRRNKDTSSLALDVLTGVVSWKGLNLTLSYHPPESLDMAGLRPVPTL